MSNITALINTIRAAISGKDVRETIASLIETVNTEVESIKTKENVLEGQFNSLIINAGNSNAEIVAARTSAVTSETSDTVGHRIDGVDSSLNEIKNAMTYKNIMDFEAVGDGVADDTAVIQAADAYSVSNNVTIIYPRKTYKITGTLNIQGQHDLSYGVIKATTDFEIFNMYPSGVVKNAKIDITGATSFTNKIFSFNTSTAQSWLDNPNQRFTNLSEIEIYSGSNTGIGIGFRAVKNVGSTGGWYISGVNITNVKIYGAIGKGLSFYAQDFVGEGGDYTSAWCDHNIISNIQFYNNRKAIHIDGKANNNQIINYIIQNDNAPDAPSDLPDIAIGKCWDRAEIKLKNLDYAYGGSYMIGGMSPAYYHEEDGIKMSPVTSGMFSRTGLYTNLCGFKTNDLSYSQGDLLKGTYSIIDEFDGNALSNKWRLTALNSNTSLCAMGAVVRNSGRHLKGIKLIPATTAVGDYVQMDMNSNCMLTKDLNFNALITFTPVDWASYGKWQVGFYKDSNNYILLEKDERNYVDNTVLFKCKSNGVETTYTFTNFTWNSTYTLFKAEFNVMPTSVSVKLLKEWTGGSIQGSGTEMWVTDPADSNSHLGFATITTNIPSGLLQPYFRIECNQAGQNTRLYVHSLEIISRRLKTQ